MTTYGPPTPTTQDELIDLIRRNFARYVCQTDCCWNWTGDYLRGKMPYGRFVIGKKKYLAHRAAWWLHTGTMPPSATLVMHICDNPRCVRPSHLKLGTHQDNRNDCVQKGRANCPKGDKNGSYTKPERRRRGESHGMAKLSEQQVREIRVRGKEETNVSLGIEFGVTPQAISRILHRKTWKDVL